MDTRCRPRVLDADDRVAGVRRETLVTHNIPPSEDELPATVVALKNLEETRCSAQDMRGEVIGTRRLVAIVTLWTVATRCGSPQGTADGRERCFVVCGVETAATG